MFVIVVLVAENIACSGFKIVVKSRSVVKKGEKRALAGEKQGLLSLLRPHQPGTGYWKQEF